MPGQSERLDNFTSEERGMNPFLYGGKGETESCKQPQIQAQQGSVSEGMKQT